MKKLCGAVLATCFSIAATGLIHAAEETKQSVVSKVARPQIEYYAQNQKKVLDLEVARRPDIDENGMRQIVTDIKATSDSLQTVNSLKWRTWNNAAAAALRIIDAELIPPAYDPQNLPENFNELLVQAPALTAKYHMLGVLARHMEEAEEKAATSERGLAESLERLRRDDAARTNPCGYARTISVDDNNGVVCGSELN